MLYGVKLIVIQMYAATVGSVIVYLCVNCQQQK